MPDWTDTLTARQRGEAIGFLATDLPLEEQDPAVGGPRTEQPTVPDDARDVTAGGLSEVEPARRAGDLPGDLPPGASPAPHLPPER